LSDKIFYDLSWRVSHRGGSLKALTKLPVSRFIMQVLTEISEKDLNHQKWNHWRLGLIIFSGLLLIKSPAKAIQSPFLTEAPSPENIASGSDSIAQQPASFPIIAEELRSDSNTFGESNSVSRFSDIDPTSWVFQALQSLVERYGVITGYPDQTFQGNRAVTRYEFAAGLSAALDHINSLTASGTADLVSPEDLETIRTLQEAFATELSALRGQVDFLEADLARMEAQQFSTTTRLFGQAIVGVQGRTSNQADVFPRDGIRETSDPGTNINLITNAQLSLLTQFTERSFLLTGLQFGSGSTFPSLTNNTRVAYESPTDNDLIVSDLTYRFAVSDNLAAYVGATGVNPVTAFRGPNRVASAGSGPISFLAQRNPILNIGFGSTGAGFDWQFAPQASLQAVYAAATASDPRPGNGLFDGGYVVGSQLLLTPTDPLDIAIYYLNSYSPFGFLGTGTGDDQLVPITPQTNPLNTHAFGTTINWQISPKFTTGGWAGYTHSSVPNLPGSVETVNWMLFLNFPDLLGEGNLGGIYIGQPPKITQSNLPTGLNIPNFFRDLSGSPGGQPGTTTHVEAFYRWQVTNNISVTPGLIMLFQPRHTPNSDPIFMGAIRTTFRF
jgi:Carbohydrate-selective porin, OprB family/S-layer homology domain